METRLETEAERMLTEYTVTMEEHSHGVKLEEPSGGKRNEDQKKAANKRSFHGYSKELHSNNIRIAAANLRTKFHSTFGCAWPT